MNEILALDIGYGFTKAVCGEKKTVFPSVVGYAEQIRYKARLLNGNGHNGKGDIHLHTPEGERFVGELALHQSRVHWTPQDRKRTGSATLATLALGAFYRLGIDGTINIVTGLPVDWYGDRDALVEQLSGKHIILPMVGDPAEVHVGEVIVVPQPFGSLFALILNAEGQIIEGKLAQGRIAVIDIGMHTTDYVLADALQYIEPGSGSITTAMARVYELVGRAINDEFDLSLDLHHTDRALRGGKVSVFGEERRIAHLAEPVLGAVAEEILAKATTLWDDGRDLDTVLVTGGGAGALGPYLSRRFPHAHILPNAALANVRGFHHYGVRKWGRVKERV